VLILKVGIRPIKWGQLCGSKLAPGFYIAGRHDRPRNLTDPDDLKDFSFDAPDNIKGAW
jgi:hypothetical protein